MLRIKEIENQEIWDNFVVSNNSDTFLQSWAWGEFNENMGDKIWRLGLYYKESLKAVCLVIKVQAKRGSFLFIPHGPIFESGLVAPESNPDNQKILQKILKYLVDYLSQNTIGNDCSFFRIAPILSRNEINQSLFKDLGLREAPIHIHSELSWILNIAEPEETILSKMRKTTRYLIRQAQNSPILIKRSFNPIELKEFYNIYQETEKRHHFVAFNLDYLEKEFSAFSKDKGSSIYLAYYKNKLLSSAVIIKYGKSGFYHHGASTNQYPKIPASYILHWEVIRDLKKEGFTFYNFWGIAPEDKPNHPWQGITLFKKGFGGHQKEYLHTKDYPLKWSYWTNWIVETIRRIKRNY